MSTPISDRHSRLPGRAGTIGLALAALAACSQQEGTGETQVASQEPSARVDCAVNGALGFTPACTTERLTVDGTPVLVVRHADGGFRRFEVLPDGPDEQGADPAPLLLWIHGGPLASWNAWHWRWNAQVVAAAGYRIALVNFHGSTGWGDAFARSIHAG